MLKSYHGEICRRALGSIFSSRALDVIIAANLAQDGLRGQIGHPEFHFDDNSFQAGSVYIEEQRQIILDTLNPGKGYLLSSSRSGTIPAWEAFGRLTHAGQDFYAHSNYIKLWVNIHHPTKLPPLDEVTALQSEILNHPDLRSGKVYLWDWVAFIPGLHGLARRILPRDSHTHMNLDSPKSGQLFPYALEAAVKRTIFEYEQITKGLDPTSLARFTGY